MKSIFYTVLISLNSNISCWGDICKRLHITFTCVLDIFLGDDTLTESETSVMKNITKVVLCCMLFSHGNIYLKLESGKQDHEFYSLEENM